MNKKYFCVIAIILILFTLNACAAQEIDNSTIQDDSAPNEDVLAASQSQEITQSSKTNTNIEITSNDTFDAVGEYFKVRLSDENNNSIGNAKVYFTVAGKTYNKNTDSNGNVGIQINLKDGSYIITAKFLGNSMYAPSSKTTTITMNNTRIVDEGLSGAEIQQIIDSSKTNNVILFKGKSYENVNLVITKRLTLVSNSNTVLKSTSSNPVIKIMGKDSERTTIKGFNIESGGDGIAVYDSDYAIIMNNVISSKGNGIVASKVNYLNITNNEITKNSKNGIVLAESENGYIIGNKITNNGLNGIAIAKSKNTYIYSNTISNNKDKGIYASSKVNGVNYWDGPHDLFISQNTISNNYDGVYMDDAGDNIIVTRNNIVKNSNYGMGIRKMGKNVVQSNVISGSRYGLYFLDILLNPINKDISYNAIFDNSRKEVEYHDFDDSGLVPFTIGENWYTDYNTICYKINTKNLKFKVTQIGPNTYSATFYDSKGNVATLLPDRELTYQTNDGQTVTVTVSGGTTTFEVDAANGDIVKATVDESDRMNIHDADIPEKEAPKSTSYNYDYPSIDYYDLFDDVGAIGDGGGNGSGTGEGSHGSANEGKGASENEGSDVSGNSTTHQNVDSGNKPVNNVNNAQNYESQSQTAQQSASETSSADSPNQGSSGQSVVKQITLDEDDIVKISGISLIILLMLVTIAFYYRDDIKEMKSKM